MIRLTRPRFWSGEPKSVLQKLIILCLWPLSKLYNLGFRLHHFLSAPRPIANCPKVICVGNAIVGGSGKTPCCEALQRLVLEYEMFKSPVILTKGYKGRIENPVRVDITLHTVRDVGDEALMLAQKGHDVIVSQSRRAGLAFIAQQNHYDVVIMDDGLQNPHIKPDLSFCVVDAGFGFGNGQLLPAGPLRQPLSWLQQKAIDAFIIIGDDPFDDSPHSLGHIPSFAAKFHLNTLERKNDKRYLAFAGIGRPEKFFDTLRQNGSFLQETIGFPDHHDYTEGDIRKLVDSAKAMNLRLITTEKDAVKIDFHTMKEIDVARALLSFEDRGKLAQLIKQILV